ncbi:MAG: indole-3-glycerol-phosphate synthase [Archaeoglobaceae archaeon]|nr:indole-3-glycerol-phosphate synthase [Archaeoglobaceae archaeon]MDW7989391.1 indole-3-glycerol-phosphate synthase [Archaeoglobaceae archaeon]
MAFGFEDAIKVKNKNAVIGEVKCYSPTFGDLLFGRDPVEIAKIYEKCGCVAISYITASSFRGDLKTLKKICNEVSLPVLRKDFVKSKEDIEKTCESEAKALLLIVRILKEKTPEFIDICFEHEIEPVVEIFNERDLNFAKNTKIVLINNRDIFNPYDVSIERTTRIAPKVSKTKISGSGINKIEDLHILKFVDAVLIGTSFMLAEKTEDFVRSFVEAKL